MARCPDCGAEVETWASVCHNCEATLADGRTGRRHEESDGPDGNQQGPSSQRGAARDQPSNRGRAPRGGNGRRSGRGGAGGGDGRGGKSSGVADANRSSGSGDGISRRALLAGAVGAVGLAGGGYLGYRRFLGSDGDGANATTREFLAAIDEGDADRARSLVHDESPAPFDFDASGTDASLSVDGVRHASDEYDVASASDVTVVAADVTTTGESDTQEGTFLVELRKDDGEWKVWLTWPEGMGRPNTSSTATATEPPSAAPVASFDFEWDGTSESPGALTITHQSGEGIAAGTLRIRGSNPAADNLGGTWDGYHPEMGPDDEVMTGDSLTVDPVASDTEITLVWESEETDDTRALADWAGPDA